MAKHIQQYQRQKQRHTHTNHPKWMRTIPFFFAMLQYLSCLDKCAILSDCLCTAISVSWMFLTISSSGIRTIISRLQTRHFDLNSLTKLSATVYRSFINKVFFVILRLQCAKIAFALLWHRTKDERKCFGELDAAKVVLCTNKNTCTSWYIGKLRNDRKITLNRYLLVAVQCSFNSFSFITLSLFLWLPMIYQSMKSLVTSTVPAELHNVSTNLINAKVSVYHHIDMTMEWNTSFSHHRHQTSF